MGRLHRADRRQVRRRSADRPQYGRTGTGRHGPDHLRYVRRDRGRIHPLPVQEPGRRPDRRLRGRRDGRSARGLHRENIC